MIEVRAELGTVRIPEAVSELPDLSGASRLFMDEETTSGDDFTRAFHPYIGHRSCGTSIAVDDEPVAWYIPFRHRDSDWNLPVDNVRRWFSDCLPKEADWINHGIKFDAHFKIHDGYEHTGRLIDTVVLAKMIHSDRLSFDLKPLCRDWLGMEMSEADEVAAYLEGLKQGNKKVHDYGLVPADILGKYAGQDVFSNRALYDWCCEKRPAELAELWETEIALTPVLFDMEREGLHVDETELKMQLAKSLGKILRLHQRLCDLTGEEFVDSNPHLFDLLINKHDLPILAWNVKGGEQVSASFDKGALARYCVHPQVLANDTLREAVPLIAKFRKESSFKSNILEAFLKFLSPDGRVHPKINQVLRTGRMSCSEPNAMALSKRAKKLVHPPEGYDVVSADASQVEFRVIAHYIRDESAIEAYTNDPNTDFHQWVAESVGISRKHAKNLNFAMAFGAGRERITKMLANDPDIMAAVGDEVAALNIQASRVDSEYRRRCRQRAEWMYDTYHATLPSLKRTSYRAAKSCRKKGYIFNAYGRRRHLPKRAAHNAFNSLVQSCAMDIIKERINATAPRYNIRSRSQGIRPFIVVHDELASYVPSELARDPAWRREYVEVLSSPRKTFRVPFSWDLDSSDVSWAAAVA